MSAIRSLFVTLLFVLVTWCVSGAGRGYQGAHVYVTYISSDTVYEMLLMGAPPSQNTLNVERMVCARYGFIYRSVSNECMHAQSEHDSLDRINDSVALLISLKKGHDWKQRFNKEIETAYLLQEKVMNIADKQSYIKVRKVKQEKLNKSFSYAVDFTSDKDVCIVEAFGDDEQRKTVVFYKMKVNARNKKVELLSDKPEPCDYFR